MLHDLQKLTAAEKAKGSTIRNLVCIAISLLFMTSVLRLIYYCYSTTNDRSAFWESTQYFVFYLPAGLVILAIQIAVILCELSLLPAYVLIADYCIAFWQCATYLNYRTALVGEQLWINSPLSTSLFDDVLKPLIHLDSKLNELLDHLDRLLGSLLGILICGNTILLTSITAQGFISATLVTPIYLALFSASVSSPVIALIVVITVSTLVHDSAVESNKRWVSLLLSRQHNREKGNFQSESERLMTLMYLTANRKHSLLIMGAIHAQRSFGVTLIAGFVGFICFLIERAEHFAHSNYIAEFVTHNKT
ncbi:uncharacterized protein LOC129591319 [Paramacrobiotus metropolitanus]|uniref:uncharacterized protein LOC129591319 n=1 Tax=Paramacrobiotus metropolitanus TaxID=2943436 RepID=UPI0024462F4F|nr:uncharacterized protein LOC129591319 [Paramacrobiotus metropolitanus]